MALNFPTSPSNGDTHVFLGSTYTYDSTNDRWSAQSSSPNGTVISAQASDPTTRDDGAALQEGDIYYNTADDAIKTYDGAAWNASGGGGSGPGNSATFVGQASGSNAGSLTTTFPAENWGYALCTTDNQGNPISISQSSPVVIMDGNVNSPGNFLINQSGVKVFYAQDATTLSVSSSRGRVDIYTLT